VATTQQLPRAPYWFTIGGRVEGTETHRQTAIRELREEVGLVVQETDLVGPVHHGEHSCSLAGVAYRSHATFFAAKVEEVPVRPLGLSDESITDARWWAPEELAGVPFSNPRIPEIVALAVLAANGE
jgi:8-oxo-dGTP pyrophosphatase MutT (NUDIX family)